MRFDIASQWVKCLAACLQSEARYALQVVCPSAGSRAVRGPDLTPRRHKAVARCNPNRLLLSVSSCSRPLCPVGAHDREHESTRDERLSTTGIRSVGTLQLAARRLRGNLISQNTAVCSPHPAQRRSRGKAEGTAESDSALAPGQGSMAIKQRGGEDVRSSWLRTWPPLHVPPAWSRRSRWDLPRRVSPSPLAYQGRRRCHGGEAEWHSQG